MIARIWHGWTKPADAKAYEKLLRDEIFPSIAARKIEGYRGAELFVREDATKWNSLRCFASIPMDAVKEFAGTRCEQAGDLSESRSAHHANGAGSALSRRDRQVNCTAGEALALQPTCATLLVMELASKLREILDDEIVADDPETVAAHSGDKWFATHPPEVVVFAKSTADVSKLLQFASREKVPVTARGGGFGYVGGCVPARGGIALSLMRMNRIKEINFTDAVAIVEPGVFTAELKAACAHRNYFIRLIRRA